MWACFSRAKTKGLTLVLVKGTLNLSFCVGTGLFLFQHDCEHGLSRIHKELREFGVEELDWPAES